MSKNTQNNVFIKNIPALTFLLFISTASYLPAEEPPEVVRPRVTPINISLWPKSTKLPHRKIKVRGLSVNLFLSDNESVYGAELGVINSTNRIKGAQFGVLNFTNEFHGIQAGGWNVNLGVMSKSYGAQFGIINVVGDKLMGAQCGMVNSVNHLNGIQVGVYNHASTVNGLQLGVFNEVGFDQIKGLQMGLLNVEEREKDTNKFVPLVNFRVFF